MFAFVSSSPFGLVSVLIILYALTTTKQWVVVLVMVIIIREIQKDKAGVEDTAVTVGVVDTATDFKQIIYIHFGVFGGCKT